jgi:hypothetical protein
VRAARPWPPTAPGFAWPLTLLCRSTQTGVRVCRVTATRAGPGRVSARCRLVWRWSTARPQSGDRCRVTVSCRVVFTTPTPHSTAHVCELITLPGSSEHCRLCGRVRACVRRNVISSSLWLLIRHKCKVESGRDIVRRKRRPKRNIINNSFTFPFSRAVRFGFPFAYTVPSASLGVLWTNVSLCNLFRRSIFH